MYEASWIKILPMGLSATGKTKIWHVVTADTVNSITLGEIRWFGPWRKYVFRPEKDTVYEEKCLRDIAQFCERESQEKRKRHE